MELLHLCKLACEHALLGFPMVSGVGDRHASVVSYPIKEKSAGFGIEMEALWSSG